MFANFFDVEAAQLIVLIAGGIYAVAQVFIPGLSPIAWLKQKLGWADLKVKILVQGFFLVLAVLAQWITGELALDGLTLTSLMTYFGVWYGWSQLAWQTLSAEKRALIANGG